MLKAIAVAGAALLFLCGPSPAMECNPETTGLKYVTVEGSGFASAIFFIPLIALAPLAGPTDVTGQYRCHVAVIGRDAVSAKWKNRPQVEPTE